MSSIVKATKVMLDNQKFTLSPEIAPPVESHSRNVKIAKHHEEEVDPHDAVMEEIKILKEEAQKSVEEASAQAQERLISAARDAEGIVNEAYDNAKIILEDAKAKGYKEGFETGLNESYESMSDSINEGLAFKNSIISQYKEKLSQIEPEVVDIVVSALEKILNKKMDEDDEYIEGLIKSAIQKCTYTERLVLRVSPKDYGVVLSIKDRIVSMYERIDDIEIKQDMSFEKGSCVIDTISGSIDSSISTQVEFIKIAFDEILKSE